MTTAERATAFVVGFLPRFSIGLLVPLTTYPARAWLRGLALGALLSLQESVMLGEVWPSVGGIVVGVLVGWVYGRWFESLHPEVSGV